MWFQTAKALPQLEVYRRVSPAARWLAGPARLKQVLIVAVTLALFGVVTHGFRTWMDRSSAGANFGEFRRLTENLAAADRLSRELDAVKLTRRQILLGVLHRVSDPQQEATARTALELLIGAEALILGLEEEILRVRMSGSGAAVAERKMAQLRKAFQRICALTGVRCLREVPKPHGARESSMGEQRLARFSCPPHRIPLYFCWHSAA